MSKAARQSIFILIVLVVVAFGWAGLTTLEKTKIEKEKISLEKQVEEYRGRETAALLKNKQLEDSAKALEASNADLKEQLKKFASIDLKDIDAKIKQITSERDDWQKKVQDLQKEREALITKLAEKAQTAADQQKAEATTPAASTTPATPVSSDSTTIAKTAPVSHPGPDKESDAYWAQVLKEKASLEIELQNLTKKLNDGAVQVVELKKQNSDMQLELSNLKNDKEGIERQIKYGSDLSDTLSLELARAQNDKKFLNDRLEKMSGENATLREQIKRLTSTKIALEKSIVRLQDEKKDVEKKLLETENVIQNRVDEIWQIKEGLDKSLKPAAKNTTGKSEIELPPIVVSSSGQTNNPSEDLKSTDKSGFNGNIVSINNENNFVIVDIGENSGIKLGDNLNVYHGSEYIAGLEVIQVRKDIAAADIKSKSGDLQVGDIVR